MLQLPFSIYWQYVNILIVCDRCNSFSFGIVLFMEIILLMKLMLENLKTFLIFISFIICQKALFTQFCAPRELPKPSETLLAIPVSWRHVRTGPRFPARDVSSKAACWHHSLCRPSGVNPAAAMLPSRRDHSACLATWPGWKCARWPVRTCPSMLGYATGRCRAFGHRFLKGEGRELGDSYTFINFFVLFVLV